MAVTEKNYEEFFDYIAGHGPHALKGNGILVYAEMGDPDSRAKYDACLELENRGKLYRELEETGKIFFKAIEIKVCPLCKAGFDSRYWKNHLDMHTDSIFIIYPAMNDG